MRELSKSIDSLSVSDAGQFDKHGRLIQRV